MSSKKTPVLMSKMKSGKVYRRSELEAFSTSIDRDLKSLCDSQSIIKLSPGLYYRPKQTVFGVLPPEDDVLIYGFLKDDRFLVTSFNLFNGLGLGLTQLYNTKIVYNYKRHGRFELGSQTYEFRRVHNFPQKLSREFLIIDLVNNLKNLAENECLIKVKLQSKIFDFDQNKIIKLTKKYGRIHTKKLIAEIYDTF